MAFHREDVELFKASDFNEKFKQVFQNEIKLNRIIKFPEAHNIELMKTMLKYFHQNDYIEKDEGSYKIADIEKLKDYLTNLETELREQLKFNLKAI